MAVKKDSVDGPKFQATFATQVVQTEDIFRWNNGGNYGNFRTSSEKKNFLRELFLSFQIKNNRTRMTFKEKFRNMCKYVCCYRSCLKNLNCSAVCLKSRYQRKSVAKYAWTTPFEDFFTIYSCLMYSAGTNFLDLLCYINHKLCYMNGFFLLLLF